MIGGTFLGDMPTPMHLKPATAAWIVRERKRLGLKPKDVADRLRAMGLEASEATVKVWESNANRRPGPYNLEGLERLFESQAPIDAPPDPTGLSAAIEKQAAAISELAAQVKRLADRSETEMATALVELVRSGLLAGAPSESPAGSPPRP